MNGKGKVRHNHLVIRDVSNVLKKHTGLLRLQDGGYLFLRDPRVSKEPKDDMLAVMVTGRWGDHYSYPTR